MASKADRQADRRERRRAEEQARLELEDRVSRRRLVFILCGFAATVVIIVALFVSTIQANHDLPAPTGTSTPSAPESASPAP